jgi:hypothetical protein
LPLLVNFKERTFERRNSEYRFRPREIGHMAEVTVDYEIGGWTLGGSRTLRRGISIKVGPVELTENGGTCYTIHVGGRSTLEVFVIELARYSAKKMLEIAVQLDPHAPEISRLFEAGEYVKCDQLIRQHIVRWRPLEVKAS